MNTQVLNQEIRARKETTPKNGAALGRLKSGESDRRNELKNDGTPYAVKVARTVLSGGKGGDNLKALPIAIKNDIYSELYEQAKRGDTFTDLSQLVISRENILLAYRNIKNNTGSTTAGTNKLTINDIKNLTVDEVVEKVRHILSGTEHGYRPKPIRRKYIPKPNGELSPLGIPCIWDRLIQQCLKQVLEPICEAKFSKHSYGFRPNKSTENAIADTMQRINRGHLHFVIEFDIKKFFDNVNHSKLIRQMWTMGIRDKWILHNIRQILKAPIKEKGQLIYPDKGTPQGGIISPLLANIVLNELDHWIESNWEESPVVYKYSISKNGSKNSYTAMRKTKLKEMYIQQPLKETKLQLQNGCRKG